MERADHNDIKCDYCWDQQEDCDYCKDVPANKHILAFDPGTTNFAWCHWRKYDIFDSKCIKVAENYDSNDASVNKIVPIIDKEMDIYKPDLVVVENQFKQKMNNVATMIRTVAKVKGIPFKTIHPNSVKAHFGLAKAPTSLTAKAKHTFNKTQAVNYVNSKGHVVTDHNCADAIMLAIYADEKGL